MSKPSSRKQEQRKKKRLKKEEHSSKYLAKKEVFRRFPEIVYEVNDAPERLVNVVKQTLGEIVGSHEKLLDRFMLHSFHQLRALGHRELKKQIHKFWTAQGEEELMLGETYFESQFENILGTLLISRLSDSLRTTYFPFHCVDVILGEPKDKTIWMRFRSMDRRKTEGDTVYLAGDKMSIFIDGVEKHIAFTRHALERICERTVYESSSYGGVRQAFVSCNSDLRVVRSVRIREQHGFTLFNPCVPGVLSQCFAERVRGEYSPKQLYLYRVGYCPVAVDGDLAIAKTLLVPGMDGTPEYEKSLRPKVCSSDKREEIRRAVGEQTFTKLVTDQDFTLMKRFHDDGVPQVLAATELLSDIS